MLAFALLTAACGDITVPCSQGELVNCECDNGAQGQTLCLTDGQTEICVCCPEGDACNDDGDLCTVGTCSAENICVETGKTTMATAAGGCIDQLGCRLW